ncbi:MAG: SDR family NAD(P)-dependent oxidoreductase [Arachnia sp.]
MQGTSVAVITGGGQGIGRAVAERLAQDGIDVAVADIAGDRAEEAAGQIAAATSARAIGVALDVADADSARNGLQQITRELGPATILINNAGLLSNTPYDVVTQAEWDRVMRVNLWGAMVMSQAAIPAMIAQGWGRIINMASLAGRNGGVSVGPAYAVSKAGLIGLTKHLAGRLASHGITVNAVSPGTTVTPLTEQFTPSQMEAINAAIPAGRLGLPNEIAAAVSYLASVEAGFTTGADIDINGGMYFG